MFFPGFEYHIFYALYPFVTYLLTSSYYDGTKMDLKETRSENVEWVKNRTIGSENIINFCAPK
jgi:hypothetical protein